MTDPRDRKEYMRRWRIANAERLRAYDRLYARENAEKKRQWHREWSIRNAEHIKEYEAAHPRIINREQRRKSQNAWKTRNPERYIELRRAWYAANKEHVREYGREYRRNNLERKLADDARRRAVKLQSSGTYKSSDIKDLLIKQKGRCAYYSVCGNCLEKGKFHRDHIEPLVPKDSNRPPGTNTINNIQLLCGSCNSMKRNSDPYKFTQQHEGRLFPDLPKRKVARCP